MRPVMGSEYDVPYVHAILDELEKSKAATQKWYDEAHEKRRELRRIEEQYELVKTQRDGYILKSDQLEEQLEALRSAASKTLHEYDLWAEDANDGEFAIWSRDGFMASFIGLRKALNPAIVPGRTRNDPEQPVQVAAEPSAVAEESAPSGRPAPSTAAAYLAEPVA